MEPSGSLLILPARMALTTALGCTPRRLAYARSEIPIFNLFKGLKVFTNFFCLTVENSSAVRELRFIIVGKEPLFLFALQ
jgi:hypothetical protein